MPFMDLTGMHRLCLGSLGVSPPEPNNRHHGMGTNRELAVLETGFLKRTSAGSGGEAEGVLTRPSCGTPVVWGWAKHI